MIRESECKRTLAIEKHNTKLKTENEYEHPSGCKYEPSGCKIYLSGCQMHPSRHNYALRCLDLQ